MLNIVCVKTGSKYGADYVNTLFDMVRRNLPEGTPGRFVCLTDDPSGLTPGIEVIALEPGLCGWWAKLYLFSPDTFPAGDRVIYLDLDLVVTGPLDALLDYSGSLAMLADPFEADCWNSGIMLFEAGKHTQIWHNWVDAGRPEVAGGDQAWIQSQVKEDIDFLQVLYPNKFKSFKLDCFDAKPPRNAMVVYFHGEPKPHNCGVDWVEKVWKIGGGTAQEIEIICNTAEEVLRDNIRSACKRDLPWINQEAAHKGHAVIVGGAPSLKTKLEDIRGRKERGETIFATNGTFKYLQENGINPDALVVVDAQAANTKFIPFNAEGAKLYIASQCHPEVFNEAHGDTILWHCYAPELADAIENPEKKPECLIACGSTVGLNAMGLAYALGYRILHVYGMDSSYDESEHHAYEQSIMDNEVVLDIECAGRKFRAASWMIAQADQFQQLVTELQKDACEITVHGYGLIPWIALNLQYKAMPDTEMVEHDGIWWPSKDEYARPFIKRALKEIPKLVELCRGHQVCVQAGGNVGLWPKELAKSFDLVVTFEPDALNFSCLKKNCTERNIEAYNVGLGEHFCRKGLHRMPDNCGAHGVVDGDEFEMATIDSLVLEACDLIQLDVEGYEFFALKGAENTIRKFHPVISIEQNNLCKRYGVEEDQIRVWLSWLGYSASLGIGRDVIFTHNEKEKVCNSKLTECTAAH